MKKNILLFGLLFLAHDLFAQDDSLFIKGNLQVLIGDEITVPQDVVVDLNNHFRFELSDSLGNFIFYELKPGNYRLIARGLGYKTLDTTIILKDQSLSTLKLLMKAHCDVDKNIAEQDIKNKKPRLLLIGSIAPIYYKNQKYFERKFHIKYYDYGDTPPAIECVIQYNRRIFDYLDSKYGKTWRQEVRQDVIGL